MNVILEVFRPDFALHYALWACAAMGILAPLIGSFFMLRRMTLLGLALPQVAAAGIALAFFLQGLGVGWSLHADGCNDRFMALAGACILTFSAILLLTVLERRGSLTSDSRLGALYCLSFASAILLVAANPAGKFEMLSMLQGEIVAVSPRDFRLLLAINGGLIGILALGYRRFLLCSFDPDMAEVLGIRVALWDGLLYALIAVAVSAGTLIVGPLLAFALLILPPLAARRFARSPAGLMLLSSGAGGLSAVIGFLVSYRLDWPVGPTVIAVCGAALLASVALRRVFPGPH